MILHACAQRSPEWFALRAGKLTGSCAKDMLAKGKGSAEAVTRRDLKYKLIAERLSGRSQDDGYVNAAMQWGVDHEAEALLAYQAAAGVFVDPIGFVQHDILQAGTSPDGFVGTDGIVSIKCPKTATHLTYLRTKTEPTEHAAQNTHELWLCERAWVDFVSYDPRLPDHLKLFILRVTRTPAAIAAYDTEARTFLGEVDTEVHALLTVHNLSAVLEASLAI